MWLITRIVIANTLLLALAAPISVWLKIELMPLWMQGFVLVLYLLLAAAINYRLVTRLKSSLQAFEFGLLNFQDNDFSVSLADSTADELANLVGRFNNAADSLRTEKQAIYQRELLLDRILHNSPNLVMLVDRDDRIMFSNEAARHYFNNAKRLEGMLLWQALDSAPEIKKAVQRVDKGLFTLVVDDDTREFETWHLDRAEVRIHQQVNTMISLRHMSQEINRQEVAVWKKVLRVISHELNNSLGPMISMINSGKQVAAPLNNDKLARVFNTLQERTEHLNEFVQSYVRFARLPLPTLVATDIEELLLKLVEPHCFTLEVGDYVPNLMIDPVQIEQVVINLVKNAHEAGGSADEVKLRVHCEAGGVTVRVLDRGQGMSDEVLSQALLPFYSTKKTGSGIGLTLVREIVDAHQGRISITNRLGGGTEVMLWFSARPAV